VVAVPFIAVSARSRPDRRQITDSMLGPQVHAGVVVSIDNPPLNLNMKPGGSGWSSRR
jgi:hypothetical protein